MTQEFTIEFEKDVFVVTYTCTIVNNYTYIDVRIKNVKLPPATHFFITLKQVNNILEYPLRDILNTEIQKKIIAEIFKREQIDFPL